MSKEIREQIDKFKNWKQPLNELKGTYNQEILRLNLQDGKLYDSEGNNQIPEFQFEKSIGEKPSSMFVDEKVNKWLENRNLNTKFKCVGVLPFPS